MLELEHEFRVIDVHVRLDAEVDGTRREGSADPERLERELHQAGIVQAIVFPQARPDSYLRANNSVARHAVDRPFVPFARINGPRDPRGTPAAKIKNLAASRDDHHVSPADVEQYAYGDRFHGFRLDPILDGLPDDEVLDELESVGKPVLTTVGEGFPPAALEATLLRRNVPIIAAHFGGYPLNRELMGETIDLLESHDDCYVDTSAVRYRDVLERALREHPDRVLFGSGTPDVHPNVGIMEMLTLDLPEDAMRRAFSKNVERVLGDALAEAMG